MRLFEISTTTTTTTTASFTSLFHVFGIAVGGFQLCFQRQDLFRLLCQIRQPFLVGLCFLFSTQFTGTQFSNLYPKEKKKKTRPRRTWKVKKPPHKPNNGHRETRRPLRGRCFLQTLTAARRAFSQASFSAVNVCMTTLFSLYCRVNCLHSASNRPTSVWHSVNTTVCRSKLALLSSNSAVCRTCAFRASSLMVPLMTLIRSNSSTTLTFSCSLVSTNFKASTEILCTVSLDGTLQLQCTLDGNEVSFVDASGDAEN